MSKLLHRQPAQDRTGERALGGMNRGSDELLKVYQRAKQKFSKFMAWNSDELTAMTDTGSALILHTFATGPFAQLAR